MGDENPDFHPKVGDAVWYDYNDDWAEATVKKITGSTYTLDVEDVGIVEDVSKEDMLPVEFEEEEGDEEQEDEEDVDEELKDLLDGAGLGIVSFTLASAGISSVDALAASSDADLKAAGISEAGQRKTLLSLVADEEDDIPDGCILVSFPAGPLGIDINMVDGEIVVTSSKGNAAEQGVTANDRLIRVGTVDLDVKLKTVPNEQKCAEVKKIVVSLPRPLTMVFEKEKAAPVQITATFQAGALGLSVTNQPKRNHALCVTKAAGQAAENGVLIDDEIIALNEKPCRGAKSEEFKKLIQAAGRPFRLTVLRGADDEGGVTAAEPVVDKEAERKAKLAAEKKAIEEAKAKAKQDTENKKKQQAEEKKRKEEEAAKKKKEEAEAKRKKKEAEELKKKEEEEEAAKDKEAPKEYKVGQEVWYDNGEDWVEATIVTLGDLVTLELRDTGEEVEDVEKDWLAPMEYEDDGEQDEEKPEEEEEEPEEEEEAPEEEDDALNMLANMKVSSATKKDNKKEDDSKQKAADKAAEAREKAKAAEAKARKAAADKKAAADARAKAKKASSGGGGGGGFRGRKSHMSKFVSSVDKEVAVDHMHRARTARMSYASMITYASFHAKKKKEEEEANTFLKKKVKKARSKSIEKKGPQIHDGESEYQYLMRKKREEAYEEELLKEEAREEQARLREEKFIEQEEYRRQLEEEYGPQYDDEEYDD